LDGSIHLSSSDKIALWHHVGWQGALLNGALEHSIKPKYYIFGHLYNHDELERSLFKRTSCCTATATIMESHVHEKYRFLSSFDPLLRPAPHSCWHSNITVDSNGNLSTWSTIVKGLKQGASGKNLPKESARLSRAALFKGYLMLLSNGCKDSFAEESYIDYLNSKMAQLAYQKTKGMLFESHLPQWIQSEDAMSQFRSRIVAENE
jgi:Adenosine-deaminase (editase) domain